jgi:hypothetical protein
MNVAFPIIIGISWLFLILFGAVLGTFLYGVLKDKLPH